MLKKLLLFTMALSIVLQSSAVVWAEDNEKAAVPAEQVTVSEPYEVTVNPKREQEIKGWGITPANGSNAPNYASEDIPANIYRDLGISIVRFDFWTEAPSVDGMTIDYNYLDRLCKGIQLALDSGIKEYMLTVWGIPRGLQDGRTLNADKRTELGEYFVKCLDYMTKVKGLPKPKALSPQNEPGSGGNPWGTCNYDKNQYPPMFNAVSRVLDENGYGDILMIGPENAAVNRMFDHIPRDAKGLGLDDPEFFNNLDAYCIHGYSNYQEEGFGYEEGLERTKLMMDEIAKYPYKDMWQTEYCTIDISQTNDLDDQVIMSTRAFCSQMNVFRCNYWFWWVAYTHLVSQWNEFGKEYESMYFGNPTNTLKLSRRGQFIKKVYNSVPIGSYVQHVTTTDPLAVTAGYSQLHDATAFDTENGTVLVYINRDTEDRTYNFNNLDGKSAKVYTLTYTKNGKDDMYESWGGAIKDGSMTNVPLPARSTNIIVCSRDKAVEPKVIINDDAHGISENGKVYIGKEEFRLFGKLNIPAKLTIDGEDVEVKDDLSFEHTVHVKGSEPHFKIDATAMDGTRMKPEVVKYTYNPYYLISSIEVPGFVNQKTAKITGTTNVPATVVINNVEVQTDENNTFAYDMPVADGKNEVKTYFKMPNGEIKDERSFEVTADYTAPDFEILTKSGATTETGRYIVRMKTFSDDIDTMWVGDHEQEVTNVHINARNDNIVEKVVDLKPGNNAVTFYAQDYAGNISEAKTINITYNETENSPKRTKRETYSKKRKQPINIDGNLDEPEWKLDNLMTLNYERTDALLAKFGTMWDEEYFYIGVDVTDSEYNVEDGLPFQGDCVEVFLNPSGARGGVYFAEDRQLFFSKYKYNSDGSPLYKNGNYPGIEYNVVNYDGGYTTEIKIPWASMANKKAEVGAMLGLDIVIDDADLQYRAPEYLYDARTSTLCWAGDSSINYYNTEMFGLVTLVENEEDVIYKVD